MINNQIHVSALRIILLKMKEVVIIAQAVITLIMKIILASNALRELTTVSNTSDVLAIILSAKMEYSLTKLPKNVNVPMISLIIQEKFVWNVGDQISGALKINNVMLVPKAYTTPNKLINAFLALQISTSTRKLTNVFLKKETVRMVKSTTTIF